MLTQQGFRPVIPAVDPHAPVAAVGVAVGVGVVREGAAHQLVHRASWVMTDQSRFSYMLMML